MGTFGTGPFDSDGALDFVDGLAELPTGQRREVLERMFLVVRNEPEQLARTVFPDEVVAAAAVVAASLSGGASIRQQLANTGYDADAIVVTEADHELAASALNALGRAAGRDGPWHHGWTSPDDAVRARQTTEQLAAILERGQGGQDG
ncbi:MAG TPA: DUF4259 domain-containing protein [Streptosporangiaceae bacterium]|jgi:hypothetical protein|nr:DUF4259 domain-containing protein [Streptosporangiaceae bacterium]